MHLDGDDVRTTLCADLGFSKEDRDKNIIAKKISVEMLMDFMSDHQKRNRL